MNPIKWTVSENWTREHMLVTARPACDGVTPLVNDWRPATPADLTAALAAMPQSEAEQVVRDAGAQGSFDMQSAVITDLRAKLRSTDAAWVESEKRFAAATARAEKAERERDEWKRMTGAERAWIEEARTILGTLPMETLHDAARRVVAERDSLRTRLIAAETAAAQREPREYPLAEGSKWSRDSIVGSAGYELHTVTSDRFLVCYPGRSASAPFADVLALAHRRGLV